MDNITYDGLRIIDSIYSYVQALPFSDFEFYNGDGENCILVDNVIHSPYATSPIGEKVSKLYDEIMRLHVHFNGDAVVYDITDKVLPVYNNTTKQQISKNFMYKPPQNYKTVFVSHDKGCAKIDYVSGLANLLYARGDLSDLLEVTPEKNIKYVISVWFQLHKLKVDDWLIKQVTDISPWGSVALNKVHFSTLRDIVEKVPEVIIIPKVNLLPLPPKGEGLKVKVVDDLLNKVYLSDLTVGKFPPISHIIRNVELNLPVTKFGIYKMNLVNGILSVYSDLSTVTQDEIEENFGLKNIILFKKKVDGYLDDDTDWEKWMNKGRGY